MFMRLFQVAVVLFVAIISMALLAFLLTGLFSLLDSPMLGGSEGITAVSGGVSAKLFTFLVLAATALVCGIYFFWRRRRKLHR